MVKFLKYTLATFVGGIVAFFFIVIMLLVIIGIVASSDQTIKIKEKTLLHLELNGQILERTSSDPLQQIFESISSGPSTEGLNHILANIKKAADDKNISGILIETGTPTTGYATIEEIRNALIEFKKTGKFIYSFAPIYSQKAYYLASVADKVYLTPGGMLELKGIYSQRLFFKNTLEKIGVDMQVFKHGKYKSAVEPFTNEKMSDEAREQTEKYIHSIWSHVKQNIAVSRNIEVSNLDKICNEMAMFIDPSELVEQRIIDGLKYKDEIIDELKEKTGIDTKDDLNAVSNKKYINVMVDKKSKEFAKDKIAVIYGEGEIDSGSNEGIQSDDFSRTIRKARKDSSIKAIVLRINSPGGSALGSEIIWREVDLAKKTKPVIVSMGDLAASGGYYIACAADSIVAQAATLTGSIGIFGIIPNAKELFNKIGLTFDGVKTNKFADMPAINRPFTPDEKELLQAYIERGYQTFIKRCADGRHTTTDSIDFIGQGRVWAGNDALNNKLIDRIGTIDDAIAIAQRMAGIDNYNVIEMPEFEDPIQQLLKDMSGDAKAWFRSAIWGEEANYFDAIQSLKTSYPIQARLPYNIILN
ncbi:MAG: signal peptide peptidase SppA [Marinilabiliaceae bacterium]|nr:signal peptide peptidase SppA [Marinilabiliaceae bacterium]